MASSRSPRPAEQPLTANSPPLAGNPYVDWAWGPGQPYYFPPGLQDGPDKRMTLLVQLQGISAEKFVQRRLLPQEREAAPGMARARSSFRSPALPAPEAAGQADSTG